MFFVCYLLPICIITNEYRVSYILYWQIGKRIFLEEQDVQERVEYGTALIKALANA